MLLRKEPVAVPGKRKFSVLQQQHGFTLIELLIVIAIMTLLVSMVIPAVQQARERARTMACQANLRMFGQAFQSYAATASGRYPAGVTIKVTGPITDLKIDCHNYMPYLLPMFDIPPEMLAYDFRETFSSDVNRKVVDKPMHFAICPSAPSRTPFAEFSYVPSVVIPAVAHENPAVSQMIQKLDAKYSTKFDGGLMDYGVISWVETDVAKDFEVRSETDWGKGIEGMFPYPIEDDYRETLKRVAAVAFTKNTIELAKHRALSDLVDGTSCTVMMVEDAGRPQHWQDGKRVGSGEPVEGGAWADFRNVMKIRACGNNSKRFLQCDNDEKPYSFHAGVFNTLFADGHVESLSTTMDGNAFISLASVSRGDNLSDE